MAELNTITLSELDVVDSIGANDKVLLESGGRMKKIGGDGVGGGGLVVLSEFDSLIGTSRLDKTWNEIYSAAEQGKTVYIKYVSESDGYFQLLPITGILCSEIENIYSVADDENIYMASARDEYPWVDSGPV